MKYNNIIELFHNLSSQNTTKDDVICVSNLPNISNHKIGITENSRPVFFVKCKDSNTRILNIKLETITVLFDQPCQLLQEDKTESDTYTVIYLNSDNKELQQYFIDVVFLIIESLPKQVEGKTLKREINKLVSLFEKMSNSPIKSIQGLWAELLVIEQSTNPDYLIACWHTSAGDKFDFNDGKDKLEVKSTLKNQRIHRFSLEQLNPNRNSKLLIASVCVTQTGIGKNIFDLVDNITKRVSDKDLLLRLTSTVAETLGQDFAKGFEVFFDYKQAVDSLSYFDAEMVPSIGINCVPEYVHNVSFDSDLTNIPCLNSEDFQRTGSHLFKSLLYENK